MQLQITEETVMRGRPFIQLDGQRSEFQRIFASRVLAEPALKGRVLDIGCGGGLPIALRGHDQAFENLDGVDVSDAVTRHPLLKNRWVGPFEESRLPEGAYDLCYAYNVVEHIKDAPRFFAKLSTVLKPGGVFWALTPNGTHPFCIISRSIELLGLKPALTRVIRARTHENNINEISSYYQLNRRSQVTRALKTLPFVKAHFLYIPCVQWDTFFPPAVRWLPHAYDRTLGNRFGRRMSVLAYRLERGV
jgi:SAM-dependent methyltransferase